MKCFYFLHFQQLFLIAVIRPVVLPVLWKPTNSSYWWEFHLTIWKYHLKVSLKKTTICIKMIKFRSFLKKYLRQRWWIKKGDERFRTLGRRSGHFKSGYWARFFVAHCTFFFRWSHQRSSSWNSAPVKRKTKHFGAAAGNHWTLDFDSVLHFIIKNK